MSEIQSVSSNVIEILLNSLSLDLSEVSKSKNTLTAISSKKTSAKTLNEEAISRLSSGDYDISLKEYTNLTSYLSQMSSIYGNKSASTFQKTINKILNSDNENTVSSAKSFIDKMKKNGVSNSSAMKLYSALQSYSIVSNMGNYSYVNATA